jgi:hypothetical protein
VWGLDVDKHLTGMAGKWIGSLAGQSALFELLLLANPIGAHKSAAMKTVEAAMLRIDRIGKCRRNVASQSQCYVAARVGRKRELTFDEMTGC